MVKPLSVLACLLALAVGRADAQTSSQEPQPPTATAPELAGRFLVGGMVGRVLTPSSALGGQWQFGPIIGRRPKSGWGPAFELGGFRSRAVVPDGTGSAEISGHVRIRPLLGGVSHTSRFGRSLVSISLLGGYAFAKFSADAHHQSSPPTEYDLEETWVARASTDLTVIASRRLAVIGSLGYVFARPRLFTAVRAGDQVIAQSSRYLHSDYVSLVVGLAVSVF